MYTIICDARKGKRRGITTLVLVDRRRTQSLWWTSTDDFLMMLFKKKSTAAKVCSKLLYNNPRVVDASDAQHIIKSQQKQIELQEADEEGGEQ